MKLDKCSVCLINPKDNEIQIILGNRHNNKICYHQYCEECYNGLLKDARINKKLLKCPLCREGEIEFVIKCYINHDILAVNLMKKNIA